MTMTGKQRMRAAMLGEEVDRVPIWLREGFDLHRPIPDVEHFSQGWKAEPDYVALMDFAREHCDMLVGWSPGGHFNRTLGIPPHAIRHETEHVDANTRRTHTTIDTPTGRLTSIHESHRGVATSWQVKYPVESLADLEKLRSVPFEVVPVSYAAYDRGRQALGDRGVMCLGVSSPWVVMSTCMPFELALMWSTAERALVHELLAEITRRFRACLAAVFARPLDTVANMGGSEQCTPPIMSPGAYAEFVTPYDGQIVAFLKERNIPVNCHCHGRVAGALREMVKMGFDSTDPVEPAGLGGDGDVSMAEAREIVGGELTLCGNLQYDELERSSPQQIRARVREIIDTGKRRLVLAASAGAISRMTPRMIANYHAWISEAIEYGRA